MNNPSNVLVVGATGKLGSQVVDHLLEAGHSVRALARPTSDTASLEQRGVAIARGDMLDLDSLVAAMQGIDAVITSAAGYTKGATDDTDTLGNTNLAEAARRTHVKRFILTSILTSDQTPQVPHFWHKHLAEQALEERGVPFIALQPGAFLDQTIALGGNPLHTHRMMWVGHAHTPLTFVLTTDLAAYLAQAVDVDLGHNGSETIDIGWTQPVTASQVASTITRLSGQKVRLLHIPTGVMNLTGRIMAKRNPVMADMASMFAWFDTGRYVANTTRQTELFGTPPTPDEAITTLLNHLR